MTKLTNQRCERCRCTLLITLKKNRDDVCEVIEFSCLACGHDITGRQKYYRMEGRRLIPVTINWKDIGGIIDDVYAGSASLIGNGW